MNRIGSQDRSLQPGPRLEVPLPSRYPTNMAAVLVDRPARVHLRFWPCLPFSARLLTKPHQVFWWSHISVDFVTSLPSCSNTIIPVVVGHFSKMAHFLPLSKLPPAKDSTQPDSSLYPAASLGPWSARPLLPTPRLMDQLIRSDICYVHIEEGIWWTGRGKGQEGRSWITAHHILSKCTLQVMKS